MIEFAELEQFADLKLKNYSSGMLVRLAFAIMIQSDAEILLIDEVLAVGDAAFQQKCKDVFHEIRGSDRTVVLVTHDMTAVEEYCHRAMLLARRRHRHDRRARGGRARVPAGELQDRGRAGRVGRRLRPRPTSSCVDTWIQTLDGERTTNVEQHQPIEFHAVLEAAVEFAGPSLGFMLTNADEVDICGFGKALEEPCEGDDVLAPGERIHVRARIENHLAVGRYYISCRAYANHSYADLRLVVPRIVDFVVFGTDQTVGVVSIFPESSITRERA